MFLGIILGIILVIFLSVIKPHVGGAVVSWLVSLTPDRVIRV